MRVNTFLAVSLLALLSNGQKETSSHLEDVLDVRLYVATTFSDQYNSITMINGRQPSSVNHSVKTTSSWKVRPTLNTRPKKTVDSRHYLGSLKSHELPLILTPSALPVSNSSQKWESYYQMKLGNSSRIIPKKVEVSLDSCERRSFCKNHHSSNTTDIPCSCDPKCKLYGDCCYDTPLVPMQKLSTPIWSCADVKIKNQTDSTMSYYMVSSCPDNWEDENIRSQCENEALSKSDRYLSIPVTSHTSKRTYRNVFCSVCNEDLNTTTWNIDFFCREPVTSLANVTSLFRCWFMVVIPDFLSQDFLKKCDSYLIHSCPSKWNDSETSHNCSTYLSPVKHRHRIYKNKYCGMCNGKKLEILECPDTSDSTAGAPPVDIEPSFSLLLDSNFGNGNNIVGSKIAQCEKHQAYDPWKKACRDIFCGRLFNMENGKCVKKSNTSLSTFESGLEHLNYSTLNSSCPKIRIDNFKIVHNKTVTLTESGIIFQWGEYEYVNLSTILVCEPPESRYIKKFGQVHTLITYIGMGTSIVALLIKIVIYVTQREPHTLPSNVVFFMSLSLLLAQVIFLFGINKNSKMEFCICIGVLLHYCFLASFSWMTVLAYDIWKTISSKKIAKNSDIKCRFFSYNIAGWMVPLSIVTAAMAVNWFTNFTDIQPKYGMVLCWISQRFSLLIFFAIPLAIHLLVNVLFFTLTILHIAKTSKVTKMAYENTRKKDRVRFVLYVKLAFIMGLTWIFGFVATYADNDMLWYLFIFFNSIQGVYILLAFTKIKIICKGKTLHTLSTTMSTV